MLTRNFCSPEIAKDFHPVSVPALTEDAVSEFCYYNASQFEEIVSGMDAMEGKFPHNSSLAISCKYAKRFHLRDDVSNATCDQGVWRPRVPGCEASETLLYRSTCLHSS